MTPQGRTPCHSCLLLCMCLFSGWLYDTTGSYTVSFVSSGMLIAVAGLICLPVRRLAAWENGRKMQNSTYVEVRSVPAPEPDDDV